jgi:ubiquinone/menaquinone biosynthesis C-methylase UbiE
MSMNIAKSNLLDKLKKKSSKIALYLKPELYDLAYSKSQKDAFFYLNKSKKGRILYLGIGTGRIFSKIAKINRKIIGLDYSLKMISYLKKNFPEFGSYLVHGDVLDSHQFQNSSFEKIIAPHSFFTQFKEQDLFIALSNCRKWLKNGGTLITDNFSPYANPQGYKKTELYREGYSSQRKIKFKTYIEYDYPTQTLRENNFFFKNNSQPLLGSIKLNFYYPNEFRRILEMCKFSNVHMLGGFDAEKVTSDSAEIVYICKRQ